MDNNTLNQIKSLLQKIDLLEIKLSEVNKKNKENISIYKENLYNINDLYHNLCQKIYNK
jgi:hypothetical protein